MEKRGEEKIEIDIERFVCENNKPRARGVISRKD